MKHSRTFLPLLAALLFACLALADQGQQRSASARATAGLADAQKRWEALTPGEQARMQERFERFQTLPAEERRELAGRAQRVKLLRERVEREIPSTLRARMDQFPAEKRQQLLREMVEGEAAKIGSRVRELLPPEVLQRLEQARPEDRARFFAKYQQRQRERMTRFALEKLGKKLNVPQEEIARLQALPEEERAQVALAWRKRVTTDEGLLPGLTQEQWDAWLKLDPEEFFERLKEHLGQRQFAGIDSEPDASAQRPATEVQLARAKQRALQHLRDAMHPRPEDFIELADLPPLERQRQGIQRTRERCFAAIVEGQLVTAKELEDLRAQPDASFLASVQELLQRNRPARAPRPR